MEKGSGVSFDLTSCLSKMGEVRSQNISPGNNFDSYIGKIRAAMDSCRVQFGVAREFCGERDGYDACKHPVTCNHPANRTDGVMVFCRLEICPFLK
jgi:hypothetical protein